MVLFGGLGLLGALFFFLISNWIIQRTLRLIAAVERRWDKMPSQQIMLATIGLILGLVVAALVTQLILSAGPSLITISASALVYVVMGTIGVQIGFRRHRTPAALPAGGARCRERGLLGQRPIMDEDADASAEDMDFPIFQEVPGYPVIIDGRILTL